MQRQCTECGLWKYRANARSWPRPNSRVCSLCQKARRKIQTRHLHVRQTYGLTIEQYDRLVAFRNGRCHACNQARQGNLCVDHDHKTLFVRGLLCRRCNRVLGLIRDSGYIAEGLADYLSAPTAGLLGISVKVDPAKANRPSRRGRRSWAK